MRRRLPLITAIALSVVVVGLAIASGWLGVVSLRNKDEADQKAKAIQSARQMGVNLMSLDAATAQRDLDRIVGGTTGDLKNKLGSQSNAFMQQITKAKAKSTVTDVDAALVSIDGDSAEVMVSLTGTVTNDKVQNGTPQGYRYQMDLTRLDGRWLVSGLEVVP
ncbi:nuclear transport factor 2 family protein [Actinomadura mexicana]|uniref:Mce-associated membrane protein n=1 Tax=Actinomadura mexicana TaxID=134959 RepID=A0A239DKU1_9ACTN|nr:nuclear transport factor 2 family protein [Actinomadura mexicana]SNS32254.1 Mce-associated membrane protein [Actinomadura mexicana]